jgi:hypothetical protein
MLDQLQDGLQDMAESFDANEQANDVPSLFAKIEPSYPFGPPPAQNRLYTICDGIQAI